MKKFLLILVVLLLLVAVVAFSLFSSCGADRSEMTMEELTQDIILEHNKDLFKEGECYGAGCVVMSTEEKEGNTVIYAMTIYGVYEQVDGSMAKIDGSGMLPAVIVVDGDRDLVEYKVPADTQSYFDDVEALFPEDCKERIYSLTMEDYIALTAMEAQCVSDYLEEEGLEMAIKQ